MSSLKEISIEALKIAELIANIALDKKAIDPVILEMHGVTDFCDYFIILSATSHRHAQALADAIEEEMFKKGFKLFRRQADADHAWEVLDFFDVVVHIFYEELRKIYNLERLWVDAKRVTF